MPSELDDLYSAAIKEAYTLAPSDDVILETIELRHPTFLTNGVLTAVRFVRDYGTLLQASPEIYGHRLTLESDAPWNPGQSVIFVACMFEIALAPQEEGAKPAIQISIDNVASLVCRYLDAAIVTPAPIELTYREYLASNPLAPELVYSNATIPRVTTAGGRVTATASYADLLNQSFPRKVYRPSEFASLAQ